MTLLRFRDDAAHEEPAVTLDAFLAQPDATAAWPWPPEVQELPPATWPRVSSPVFLHLMDNGTDANASLHFYQDVVPPEDQRAFTALLFRIYQEVLPA